MPSRMSVKTLSGTSVSGADARDGGLGRRGWCCGLGDRRQLRFVVLENLRFKTTDEINVFACKAERQPCEGLNWEDAIDPSFWLSWRIGVETRKAIRVAAMGPGR